MFDDIYQHKYLKYPLTDTEVDIINNVWNFLELFTKRYIFISDYRKYIIKEINSKYEPEEFYILESILNKLFWNLRYIIAPLWENPKLSENEYKKILENNYTIPNSLLLCSVNKFNNENELNEIINNKITNSVFYRSFINKLIIVDRKNNLIYSKNIEGSADIFDKNYFNSYTMQILFNKKLYYKIMKNPIIIKDLKIDLPEFFYQYDYAFPNINYCVYKFGSKNDRYNRIKKMYYIKEKPKSKYWYKII